MDAAGGSKDVPKTGTDFSYADTVKIPVWIVFSIVFVVA